MHPRKPCFSYDATNLSPTVLKIEAEVCRVLGLEGYLGVLEHAKFVAGDAFEELWVVEHLHQAVDGRVTRFVGDGDRQIDERTHVLVDALEQRSATGQDHAAVVDVGGNLGPKLGKGIFNAQGDAADDALDDRVDLAGRYLDCPGTARLHVAAADLRSILKCPRAEMSRQMSS